jgi:hypothetical protein
VTAIEAAEIDEVVHAMCGVRSKIPACLSASGRSTIVKMVPEELKKCNKISLLNISQIAYMLIRRPGWVA